jgi:hypothetical protein
MAVMPRAARRSLPCVHSLYLSHEQDEQLRRFSRKTGSTASEVMRVALAEYFERQKVGRAEAKPRQEPTVAQTRGTIAQAARSRKEARGPRNAPVWPGQQVTVGTPFWEPPASWHEADDEDAESLARDEDGVEFEPPPNAVAWLVLYKRREQDPARPYVWSDDERELLVVIDTSVSAFCRLVGRRSGWFVLQPIDEYGRLLRTRQAVFAFD